jgi:hypothetical protein
MSWTEDCSFAVSKDDEYIVKLKCARIHYLVRGQRLTSLGLGHRVCSTVCSGSDAMGVGIISGSNSSAPRR